MTLDFTAIPLPAKSPWLKGMIERFWGRINVQVFSHEEGSTLSRSPDHYDPVKSARSTMDELRFKILKWIIDDYHETEHQTLKCTPMQRWRDLTALYPVRPVPSFDHVIRLTGEIIKRKISNVGVLNEGLLYADRDNEYAHLTRLTHRRGGLKKDWLIRVDPYDYGEIWILDDEMGEWLDLPCTDPGVSVGVSKYQHRLHKLVAKRLAGKAQVVTASMLGRAKAQAEAEAAGLLSDGSKSKGAARAARYASSPSYFTPMPLIGAAAKESKTLSYALLTSIPAPDAALLGPGPTTIVGPVASAEPVAPLAVPAVDLNALLEQEMAEWE